MKLKVVSKQLFWWPVKVAMPDADEAGKVNVFEFKMQFEAIALNEARQQALASEDAKTIGDVVEAELQLIRRIARNWDANVTDEDGGPLPFSPATLDAAMQWGSFRQGVVAAYNEAMNKGAERGNSKQ